jgi:HEAT repeat protein
VREIVLRALAAKGQAAGAPVVAALAGDPALVARPGVPTLLGRLEIKQSLGPLLGLAAGSAARPAAADVRERVRPLFESLRDRIERDQIRLGRLLPAPTRETVLALRELAAADDEPVRCFALYTLGELGAPDAVATIVCLLADASPTVRGYAAQALGKIADPRAQPFLEERRSDPDPTARRRIVDALAAISRPAGDKRPDAPSR